MHYVGVSSSIAREVSRLAAWTSAYVLAALLGRMTIIDQELSLSLVWPASGVAALWLLTSSWQRIGPDLATILVASSAVMGLTGAPPSFALVLGGSNVVMALVFLLVLSRIDVTLVRARRPQTLADLWIVLLAVVTAAAAGGAVVALGQELLDRAGGLETFVTWVGRNSAGMLTVGLVGMKLRGRLVEGSLRRARLRPTWGSLGVTAYTVAMFWVVFGLDEPMPGAFLLVTTSVLAAVWMSSPATAGHSLIVGVAAVVLTIRGVGPFATLDDPSTAALMAQIFVVATMVTGCAVAFSRHERDAMLADLEALQRDTAERARLFEGVLENMQEGVAVRDPEAGYLVRNAASRLVTAEVLRAKYRPGERPDIGLLHLDGTPVAPEEMPSHRSAVLGEHVRQDYAVHPEGADPIVLEVSSAPLAMDDGRTLAVVSFRDVTEARHDHNALAAFAGVVAHDLKGPLAAVSGWSQALLEQWQEGGADPEEAEQALHRVVRSAAHMGQLIDDLLSYTIVRDAPVHLDQVDLSVLAEETAEPLREGPSRALVTVQPGLRATADPVLARQVLDNLIGNAVKYVALGTRPHVRVAGRVELGWTTITVTDNGIGIPAQLRSRIFESFERAERTDYQGTGLGLAIVRRAVERSGGRIQVRDHPGGGSVFEVAFPAAAATTESADVAAVGIA